MALRNPRHERFAQEIAKGKTADQAYVLAGYTESRKNAARLKSNDDILRRIEEIVSRAADKAEASVERILTELTAIAYSDITEAVDWGEAIAVKREDGTEAIIQGVALIAAKDLPRHVRAAISEVSQTKDGIKIKFHAKSPALDMLGRHRKMFTDKVELTGKDGGPIEVADARERLAGRIAGVAARIGSSQNPGGTERG